MKSKRLTGIETPFGGLSWENAPPEKDERYAVLYLYVLLESRRLITLPYSRNVDTWPGDLIYCDLSCRIIKAQLLQLMREYTLSPETRTSFLQIMDGCNLLLDRLSALSDSTLVYDTAIKRDRFLACADAFKQSLAAPVQALLARYPFRFYSPELQRLTNILQSPPEKKHRKK